MFPHYTKNLQNPVILTYDCISLAYFLLNQTQSGHDCSAVRFLFASGQDKCEPCHSSCKSCFGAGKENCKCANYYFLHKAECVDDCPKGYFASEPQQECMQCHADCASCDGHEPTDCLSCGTNRRLDDTGHCVWHSECSMDSYVGPDGDCQRCHTRCLRCDGPGEDHCLSCKEPRFLLNTTCVKKCPAGYYEDKAGRGCERCHFSCESCDGHHSQQCTACKPGFFKQAGSCVETCSESHFGNKTTLLCERCDPSCSQCVGGGNRNCLSCRKDYVFMGQWGQCLKSCPPGYYKDFWSTDCHKCHPTCKTCKGKTKKLSRLGLVFISLFSACRGVVLSIIISANGNKTGFR
uniref:TNFR-Cys domain-containing protein n=1 Tax=Fundulus heteroclitus TaxID=8078 RepID=A0A3Q2PEM2_FUNHE